MADVPGKFYRATKVRTGVAPSSAGSIEGEVLPPVNPPGSSLNSVGLTMPSAFTVSNSPLTANGTIGVAGAGTVAQYIRGDGSLADFPESSGGGSSVSYYLNGSVDQGTIGGIAYKELSKVPILGAGTDFTINADGYIASFITDAGDPSLLEIPGGNWNFETYFSASSSGGTPTFYVELYKVSGTTATLIASSSSAPELIAFGTNLTPYFSTLAVPTTTLALTDRLAVRYYVTHSGRTITLHTENNHLCQIITTFTTGLTALNGLTAQVQNFAVGTTGTDFNIASATATHTFNLPTASATNRGALSSADWSLFTQAYNDKINSAAVTGTTTKTLTLTQQDGGTITASWSDLNTDAVLSVFGRTGAVVAANGDYTTAQVTESGNLYYTDSRSRAALSFAAGSGAYNTSTGVITIPTNNNQITNGAGYITSAALAGYVQGSASAGQVAYWSSGSAITGESNLFWDATNNRLGINNSTPEVALDLGNTGGQKFYAYNGGSGNRNGLGLDLGGNVYELSVFFAYGASDNGRITFGSLNGSTYSTKMTIFGNGNVNIIGNLTANSFIKSGGTSSQYLMADGSVSTLSNPVTGTGTTNYLPKFTGSTTIGNSALYDGGSFGGFNSTGLAARTFVVQGASSRPLVLELVENAGVHAIYFRPNVSGYNLITSNYNGGGVYLPLSLSARENSSDLVLQTNGNVHVGGTSDNGARLQVSGTSTFSSFITAQSSGGSGLRIYGGSGTNQWDMYLNGANLRFSDNTGTGSFVVDRPATFSSSVTAASDSSFNGVNVGRGGGSIFTNTRIGNLAFVNNTTGANNTSVGYGSLGSNTTGNGNSAFGKDSLAVNTSGTNNSALGLNALVSNTTGGTNTSLGFSSLGNNTTGSNNAALGSYAGSFVTGGGPNNTSSNSVYLGADSRGSASGNTNEIVIGYDARGQGSNSAVIGNSSITKTILNGSVGIGTQSPNRKLEVITGSLTTNGIRLTYAEGITAEGMDITYLNTGNTTTSFDSLYNSNSAVMQFRMKTAVSPVTAMTILGSGRIGIGFPTPSGKLSLGSDTGRKLFVYDDGGGANDIGGGMGTDLGGFSAETSIFFGNYGGSGRLSIGAWTSSQTYSTKLTIFANGNTGIGTTTDSGAKLQVNGDIRTAALGGGYVAGYWKLGRAILGTQPTETYQIIVEINGALYAIGAANL